MSDEHREPDAPSPPRPAPGADVRDAASAGDGVESTPSTRRRSTSAGDGDAAPHDATRPSRPTRRTPRPTGRTGVAASQKSALRTLGHLAPRDRHRGRGRAGGVGAAARLRRAGVLRAERLDAAGDPAARPHPGEPDRRHRPRRGRRVRGPGQLDPGGRGGRAADRHPQGAGVDRRAAGVRPRAPGQAGHRDAGRPRRLLQERQARRSTASRSTSPTSCSRATSGPTTTRSTSSCPPTTSSCSATTATSRATRPDDHVRRPRRRFVPMDLVTGRAFAVIWPRDNIHKLQRPRRVRRRPRGRGSAARGGRRHQRPGRRSAPTRATP